LTNLNVLKTTNESRLPMVDILASSKKLGQGRDALRQHNLSTVLGLVHRFGPISRSRLGQLTGLNRSTISTLVEELTALGLVEESMSSAREGLGRPSIQVSASSNVVAMSVHPELEYLAVAAVSLSGKVVLEERVNYAAGTAVGTIVKESARLIQKIRDALGSGVKVVGVGVAVPGQVRLGDGVVRFAPHLGWVEVPLANLLQQEINLPVYLDNDASLGCRSEHLFGAARNFNDVIYLWGGSGLGGGVITNGIQLRGATGYGCELGHVRISDSEQVDYSGIAGTVESLVRREDLVAALKLKNVNDEELQSALLANRTKEVLAVAQRQIDVLAKALANYVNIFNPEVIVLGGFLTALYWLDQERLLQGMTNGSLSASREAVILRTAELGSDSLLLGSAELAFDKLIANPAGYGN
jgi:predicted NBD/HSP70 family sugar kinase